jgi:hypothetical protein
VGTKSGSGNSISYPRGYNNMNIDTKRRNWVAASGIYQHASTAAESLSRANRAVPPPQRRAVRRQYEEQQGTLVRKRRILTSFLVRGFNDDDFVTVKLLATLALHPSLSCALNTSSSHKYEKTGHTK